MEQTSDFHMKNIKKLQQLVDQGIIKTKKIENIESIPYKGPVYDITVYDTHCYILENIASSNSAGGSLVCYLLGITNMDPIKFGLSFDRFLSPSRGGYMLKVKM